MKPVCVYASKVVTVGREAMEFAATHLLVLFGAGVPAELAEISIVHHPIRMNNEPILVVHNTLVIGDSQFVLEEVGSQAEENFRSLGHVVLTESSESILPGQVRVTGDWLKLGTVSEGMTVEVWRY